MNKIIDRLIKLRNTLSRETFPADLSVLPDWPPKRFFGMNHEFVRASILLKLINALSVDAFVETGTHLGRTCFLIAAQTDIPVFSSEVNKRYFRIARCGLTCFRARVHLSNDDSVIFLQRLLAQHRFRQPLFYLDAHWYTRLPLLDELRAILQSTKSFVIVIDDFKVPGDPSRGFDRYGDVVLDLDLIEQVLVDSGRQLDTYLPAYSSSIEDGDRRGWILIATRNNRDLIHKAVPATLLQVDRRFGSPISVTPHAVAEAS